MPLYSDGFQIATTKCLILAACRVGGMSKDDAFDDDFEDEFDEDESDDDDEGDE
ncbi:MAG: hypothetical protein ACREAY_01460 [Nitrososphaera sp.]|uniref:hypothetical protein n=1 Tax=Nitrososphaera sp. TaxID=1971748 RepID=UPI003D6EF4AA